MSVGKCLRVLILHGSLALLPRSLPVRVPHDAIPSRLVSLGWKAQRRGCLSSAAPGFVLNDGDISQHCCQAIWSHQKTGSLLATTENKNHPKPGDFGFLVLDQWFPNLSVFSELPKTPNLRAG